MNITTETGSHPSERDWSWWLKILGTLAVAPPGIVGCLITLLVFTRRRSLRQTSLSVYLRTQSLADMITLLQQTFYKLADLVWFLSGGSLSLVDWQDKYACQILEMLKRTLYMITIWMTVCYCLDRYVALRFPLSSKAKAMREPRTARILTAVLCVAAPVIESYYFFTITRSTTTSAEGRVCHVVSEAALRKVHAVMDNVVHIFVFTAGLPLFAIIILNILTVRAIRQQSCDMPTALTATQTTAKLSSKLNKVTLSVSAFYVVCSLPYTVIALANAAYISKPRPSALWHLLYVADFLSKLFFMSNFIVYSVMRRQFNEELKKVCVCCHCRLPRLRSPPSSGSKTGSSSKSSSGWSAGSQCATVLTDSGKGNILDPSTAA